MIQLDVTLYPQDIDPAGTRDPSTLATADYQKLIRDALDDLFPGRDRPRQRRELMALLSPGGDLRAAREGDGGSGADRPARRRPACRSRTTSTSSPRAASAREAAEAERAVSSDKQIEWFQRLEQRGHGANACSTRRSSPPATRASPELAGIWGALVGSFWTMLVTLVDRRSRWRSAAAIYLEEFAPKNRWTAI